MKRTQLKQNALQQGAATDEAAEDASQKPYHRKDLRKDLLQAALELTIERNGPAFSLRELAAREKVTHTAVYRHFADKASIFSELSREGFELLATYQRETADLAGLPPLERLELLGATYVRFARDNPGFFRVMFDTNLSGAREETKQGERAAFANLVELVRECQDAGELLPVDASAIATYLILAPHGMAHFGNIGHLNHLFEGGAPDALAVDVQRLSLAPFRTTPYSASEISAIVGRLG